MRLYLLSYGSNAATGTPFPGYLIQTDDGKNILVDTGFPPEMTGAYKQPGREQGVEAPEEHALNGDVQPELHEAQTPKYAARIASGRNAAEGPASETRPSCRQ